MCEVTIMVKSVKFAFLVALGVCKGETDGSSSADAEPWENHGT